MSEINTKTESLGIASSSTKSIQIVAAALLGISVLMAVGFAPIEVVHNATHDTRHSTGFPCH